MLVEILLVGVGGFLGAISRFLIFSAIHHHEPYVFPLGTLIINVIGCFFIALVMFYVEEKLVISTNLKLLLTVGFLSSFTTFSAFGYETLHLWRLGSHFLVFLNITASLSLGFGAILLGRYGVKYLLTYF